MRNLKRHSGLAIALALGLGPLAGHAETGFAAEVQARLASADLAGAAELSRARLAASPGDAQAQFALGTAQFLRAVEGLGQGLYDHGLTNRYGSVFDIPTVTSLPFLRIPVPDNPDPLPFTAAAFREILTEFDARLLEAEATLSLVPKGAVSLPLTLQDIALDFDHNGKAGQSETLPALILAISGADLPAGFPEVGFDESDVTWLRGYAHLLAGITDILLAHDWTDTVNLTFHSAFPKAGLPSAQLDAARPALEATMQANQAPDGSCYPEGSNFWDDVEQPGEKEAYARNQRCESARNALMFGGIGDLVAFVHLFRWPVVEPARLLSARENFLSMIALSRESWASIQAETDDDHEWVPSPRQTGPFPILRVTDATVAGWMSFLDQAEGVLNGTYLIPHWRFDHSQGVNIRRMFEEPRTLDPVLILTGPGAIPYMETGTLAPDSTLDTGMDLIGGGLIAYFLWFN